MLEHVERRNGRIIELTLDGDISKPEFDAVLEAMESGIARHGSIRLLEHVRSVGKIPMQVLWPDLKFGAKHIQHISHAAVVSDKRWVGMCTKGAASLLPGRVRLFGEAELEAARSWLQHEPSEAGNIERIFAHVSCHELETSTLWYAKLFGRAHDDAPMYGLHEWALGDSAGMQLFQDPEKAGSSTVTVFTADLDAALERLVNEGLKAREPENGTTSRLARLTDPDGNLVVLVEPITN